MSINPEQPFGHKENSAEFGSNVTVEIDLIRHAEKDSNGDITENGLEALREKLEKDCKPGEYDTYKFYLSPQKRPQQMKSTIEDSLRYKNIDSKVRTRPDLLLGLDDQNPEWRKFVKREYEAKTGVLTRFFKSKEERSGEMAQLSTRMRLEEFFDKSFVGYENLSGEAIGKQLNEFLQHFKEMAHRLRSGSKVRIFMISHRGVIEYLTKLVYMRNHPEKKPSEVSVEDIGGLVDYLEGPKVTFMTDSFGKEIATFTYKDLKLVL